MKTQFSHSLVGYKIRIQELQNKVLDLQEELKRERRKSRGGYFGKT